MKIVLLTTDTPHHTFYAWRLHERFPLRAIALERRGVIPPFPTAHPFETRRDAFEREVLLAGWRGALDDLCETSAFDSMNDPEAIEAMDDWAPEIVLVFGTGKLGPAVFGAARVACLNLHGGNPEQYRGLDSHLWTAYHADWGNLVTTLHEVDAELDTGDIVGQATLPLTRRSKIHELRALNTRACLDLSLRALETCDATGAIPARPQRQRGRYYSFMPSVLKEEAVRKFERHVRRLP